VKSGIHLGSRPLQVADILCLPLPWLNAAAALAMR
jgi:hypothetical protein